MSDTKPAPRALDKFKFAKGHPMNVFADCQFYDDVNDPRRVVFSQAGCQFRVRDFRTLCNVGGCGASECGETELGVCQHVSPLNSEQDLTSVNPVLPSPEWGKEYVVTAKVTIEDDTETDDAPREYEISYQDVRIVREQAVASSTCFPFSFGWEKDLAASLRQAQKLLGVHVRCKSSASCKKLLKASAEGRACYDSDLSKIVVQ